MRLVKILFLGTMGLLVVLLLVLLLCLVVRRRRPRDAGTTRVAE